MSLLSRAGAFVAASWFAVPLAAQPLNDSGVTQCYDSSGVIPCTAPAAADDGRYGRDAAAGFGLLSNDDGAAGFDFTKIANNGRELAATAPLGSGAFDWACTRDNITGLTWEVKTTDDSFRSRIMKYTWYNTDAGVNGGNAGSQGLSDYCNRVMPLCNTAAYVAAVNAMALCGYRDWHLPTHREVRSLVNYGSGQVGSLDSTFFVAPSQPNPHFWTISTYAADPENVWLVEVDGEADGGGNGHNHSKTGQYHVMLVRGGPTPGPAVSCAAANARGNVPGSTPTSDFVMHENGTVTHIPTGLMWKQCAEGLSGSDCRTRLGNFPEGHATSLPWSSAIAAAESSTFAGFNDWRLPNLKELHSIVETCGYEPAINRTVFPGFPSIAGGALFWSSMTSRSNPEEAWVVIFGRGGALPIRKTDRFFTLLVRSGQRFDSFDVQHPVIPGRRRAVSH